MGTHRHLVKNLFQNRLEVMVEVVARKVGMVGAGMVEDWSEAGVAVLAMAV
jgi:hypothetical protein